MQYVDISLYRRRLLSNRLSDLKQRYGKENLDPKWLLPDQVGGINFAEWLETLYEQIPREDWTKHCLKRLDEELPWLESNCHLITNKANFIQTPRQAVPEETVRKILQHIKEDPEATTIGLGKIYGLSASTIARVKLGYHQGKVTKGTK